MSHCGEGKETLEQGFDNGRVMRRPSSVNLRRFESSWAKGRCILGRRRSQISFMKASSIMERELSSDGVAKQAMGRGFEKKTCQIVNRARKRIQNPLQQRCQNVIARIVVWAKPNPNHKCETTMGVPTHYHLR
jgi:hypothetical protein